VEDAPFTATIVLHVIVDVPVEGVQVAAVFGFDPEKQ
jgi:hypothetical protein